jgi:hypothetical protein
MSRGGKREGAGAKPSWKHGKTKTIRVPVVLADEILAVARKLDENGLLEFSADSGSVIDLSGVPIKVISGSMGVMLSDLVNKGYKLAPNRIDEVVHQAMQKKVKYR